MHRNSLIAKTLITKFQIGVKIKFIASTVQRTYIMKKLEMKYNNEHSNRGWYTMHRKTTKKELCAW